VIPRSHFLDDGIEDLVVADPAFNHILESVPVTVATHTYRKQRAEDDAIVPTCKPTQRITIGNECAGRAMDSHDEFRLYRSIEQMRRDIEAVTEARICPACEDRRVTCFKRPS